MELEFKTWHQNLINDLSEFGIFYHYDAIAAKPLIIGNSLTQQLQKDLPVLGQLARTLALKNFNEIIKNTRQDYQEIITLYQNKPRMPIVMRPDGILINNQLKLIDFNIDSAIGGIWEMDFLQSRFANNPLLYPHGNSVLPNPKYGFLNLLQDIAKRYQLPEKPVLALLGSNDFNQFYKDQGHDICEWVKRNTAFDAYYKTPDLLRREGDFISDGIRHYHLLYRDAALVGSVEKNRELINLTKQAYETKTLVMSDPLDLLIEHKEILVLFNKILNGELEIKEFGDEEKKLIERYIPWTQFIEDKNIVFNGKKYNLKQLLLENRHQFVIKRCQSHAGEHVYFGSETYSDYWSDLIEKAMSSPNEKWVVQEVLFSDSYAFEYHDGQTFHTKNQRFIFSPFIFGEHFAGALVRIEQNNNKRVLALPTNSEMASAGIMISDRHLY